MTIDKKGVAITTHDLARQLAIEHTLKEINKLWAASANNAQLRKVYASTLLQNNLNKVKYW